MKVSFCSKILLKSSIIIGSLLIIPQTNWASGKEHTQQLRGQARYANGTFKKIDVVGKTTLDHVIIKGPTTIRGNLQVNDSQLNTLDTRGYTKLHDSVVHGSVTMRGRADLHHIQLNGLTAHVKGELSITDSTVKGVLDVQGQLKAVHTTCEDQVHARGHFQAENSIFKKSVTIQGNMEAHQTEFIDTVSATAKKIIWHDVTAPGLYVYKLDDDCCKSLFKRCEKCQEPQIITLSGKTTIQGSITFESKNGIVLLGEEVTIQGEIIGGILKKNVG